MTNPAETAIKSHLHTRYFGRSLLAFDTLESTNSQAGILAGHGFGEGTVVYAERQTRGRGRWGREWISPGGMGLWFSLILKPAGGFVAVQTAPLWLCAALLDALETVCRITLNIRWPNDLVHQGKKLAGILCETSGTEKTFIYLIAGIGINVLQQPSDFPDGLRNTATSLFMISGKQWDRHVLLAHILAAMENAYDVFNREGSQPFLKRWKEKSDIINQSISLQEKDRMIRGRVKDFGPLGDLILETGKGEARSFMQGEVIRIHAADD